MLELLASCAEDSARADVVRQLDGSTDPALPQRLLPLLRADPSPEVRSEAAETLASFLPDAEVEHALRDAAASDPSEWVRNEATSALEHARP
jgi:HEAT repeat protein